MDVQMIPLDKLRPDPNNPRQNPSPDEIDRLADSMSQQGIKVPLIVYLMAKEFGICDGHCRFYAAKKIELLELPAVVLPQKPNEAELLWAQLTVNRVRSNLNPMDEYEATIRLMRLNGWSASEVATKRSLSNSELTEILSLGKLNEEQRDLVRKGLLSRSKAYALTRMQPDQAQAMTQKAARGELTRDELNRLAKKPRKTPEKGKTKRFSCKLGEVIFSLQSQVGMHLSGLIDLLEQLGREFRSARKQGLDLETALAVIQQRRQSAPSPSNGATS